MTHSETIHNGSGLSRAIRRCGARYSGCPICAKALSIAEVIERHCEACGRPTRPKEMREILPVASPITDPDGVTPP
ncbi:hypothetical protein [Rhizobium chutanense]|uniref:Uncharacterized protein n=1 Tax=Rhizobium chutanense TaxID=2035448 RepID=A0A432P3V6_9HYPH|nr:hypothetical protein [Rhizobium chutanense]RUM06848.1 hypothetical protein EFR84_11680 [Rhizobium chutanense]